MGSQLEKNKIESVEHTIHQNKFQVDQRFE